MEEIQSTNTIKRSSFPIAYFAAKPLPKLSESSFDRKIIVSRPIWENVLIENPNPNFTGLCRNKIALIDVDWKQKLLQEILCLAHLTHPGGASTSHPSRDVVPARASPRRRGVPPVGEEPHGAPFDHGDAPGTSTTRLVEFDGEIICPCFRVHTSGDFSVISAYRGDDISTVYVQPFVECPDLTAYHHRYPRVSILPALGLQPPSPPSPPPPSLPLPPPPPISLSDINRLLSPIAYMFLCLAVLIGITKGVKVEIQTNLISWLRWARSGFRL